MPEDITVRNIIRNKLTLACKVDAVETTNDEKIPFNESTSKECWRLVHDGRKVINLFFGNGYTWTRNNLFCGTEEECKKEIETLGLEPLPEEVKPE